MEISKDWSLVKTLVYLLKLSVTLVNLWRYPKTDLDKTLLGFTKIHLSTGKSIEISKDRSG